MTAEHRTGAGLRARRRFRASGAVAFGAVALVAAVPLAGCSSAPAHHPAAPSTSVPDTYGGLPSFLPKDSVRADSTVTGSVARPALTSQGDTVDVVLATGRVRAQVVGPATPGQGLLYETPTTTCTFTVRLSGASVAVPIRLADFTTIDHLGKIYRLARVAHAAAPPARLLPGRTAAFTVRTVMPTGEGVLRWSPGGAGITAEWDFEVEND